ncbi:MAG: ABC transporter ATP-binding protein [Proteobacteria bacterium]|nr:ABC transporter ATP-binding protein [Pseudomonadota bacterium]
MIKVENISKHYLSGKRHVPALSDVSFDIMPKNPLTIIGKSGSGKTTLLNCLGGLEKPDRGRISVFGSDLMALNAKAISNLQRKNIGFLFQSGNLLSFLNVYENIAFPLQLNGVSGKNQKRRVTALLDYIELQDMETAMPHELSGGEKQRVAFARAIAHSPKLLLADEPTASLDTETGKNLVNLMFTMARNDNQVLVISTHDPEITGLSKHTITLLDGKLVKGDPS